MDISLADVHCMDIRLLNTLCINSINGVRLQKFSLLFRAYNPKLIKKQFIFHASTYQVIYYVKMEDMMFV